MRWACLAVGLVFVVSAAAAQHRHPSQDEALHEKFYSTWYMPDNPARSCCNNADCYPTEIKYVGGDIYARRREDGQYILIAPSKIERHRDNPDGQNHLCAPPPTVLTPLTPYSASHWEAAHEVRPGQRQNALLAILLCMVLRAGRRQLPARAGHALLLLQSRLLPLSLQDARPGAPKTCIEP
jgi:hypothetical protein